jgi:hypothetical protein
MLTRATRSASWYRVPKAGSAHMAGGSVIMRPSCSLNFRPWHLPSQRNDEYWMTRRTSEVEKRTKRTATGEAYLLEAKVHVLLGAAPGPVVVLWMVHVDHLFAARHIRRQHLDTGERITLWGSNGDEMGRQDGVQILKVRFPPKKRRGGCAAVALAWSRQE